MSSVIHLPNDLLILVILCVVYKKLYRAQEETTVGLNGVVTALSLVCFCMVLVLFFIPTIVVITIITFLLPCFRCLLKDRENMIMCYK